MVKEEVNVYRRHCSRIGIDGSTAIRPSRKTCMFRLFSAQHPRLVSVCCVVRVVRRTSKRETALRYTRVSSLMTEGTKEKSFYFRFWPICNRQGFFDVLSCFFNLYDLILLLYFMDICDSFCCGIIQVLVENCKRRLNNACPSKVIVISNIVRKSAFFL